MPIQTQTKEFSYAIFRIFELHTLVSDFSGSVKGQTLPPYLILIYTLLWLCAENCTLVTTNARLSTFWQLTKWTMVMGGGGDNRSYKSYKTPVKMSPQTNQ